MTGSWYVLVEEGRVDFGRTQCCYRPQWELTLTRHVDGDRQDAEEAGDEVARTHVPELLYLHEGDVPQRSVFRVQDGSWLVELRSRQIDMHFRVSVGELAHTVEEVAVPLPQWEGQGSGTLAGLRFLISGSFG